MHRMEIAIQDILFFLLNFPSGRLVQNVILQDFPLSQLDLAELLPVHIVLSDYFSLLLTEPFF